MATSGICNSAKVEMLSGGHSFMATQTAVTGTASTTTALTGLSSTAGLVVGMGVTGTNVAANTVISAIVSATALTLSIATTGAATSFTFTADAFKFALVKVSPSLTYSNTQTNVGTPGTGTPTTANLGTDEVSGTGYTAGGVALVNSTPSLPGTPSTTATTTFSTISWTSATISTTAGIIYNTTTRLGAAASPLNNRAFAVLDFGGTQTVTTGTLTVNFPTNIGTSAVIQLQ